MDAVYLLVMRATCNVNQSMQSQEDQSNIWMEGQLARSQRACITNRNRSEDDADQTAET